MMALLALLLAIAVSVGLYLARVAGAALARAMGAEEKLADLEAAKLEALRLLADEQLARASEREAYGARLAYFERVFTETGSALVGALELTKAIRALAEQVSARPPAAPAPKQVM